jgi:hypothetical protein
MSLDQVLLLPPFTTHFLNFGNIVGFASNLVGNRRHTSEAQFQSFTEEFQLELKVEIFRVKVENCLWLTKALSTQHLIPMYNFSQTW